MLTDDDQSNMVVALAALKDPSQRALLNTTWQQVVQGQAIAVGDRARGDPRYGRGFAVVVDEVRKLAEESQGAAADIAPLIEHIQTETGRAVWVVDEGARRTSQGADTVERAREVLERIGTAVDDVAVRVEQIAATAQQVASDSAEMQVNIARG